MGYEYTYIDMIICEPGCFNVHDDFSVRRVCKGLERPGLGGEEELDVDLGRAECAPVKRETVM